MAKIVEPATSAAETGNMVGFGKKGFADRIRRAVESQLEPDETIVVSVYVRGERGTARRVLFGGLAEVTISAFIVALTNQRLLVFTMDKLRAQNSNLLFWIPRNEARVEGSDLSGFQGEITLDLGAQGQTTLVVQRLWLNEARTLESALAPA